MKIVNKQEDFENLFLTAKLEAKKFLVMMKFILKNFSKPKTYRSSSFGRKNRTIHLHERDCSVQRRHQKLIEETPSPILTNELRNELFEKTVKMVSQIGYEGWYCRIYLRE